MGNARCLYGQGGMNGNCHESGKKQPPKRNTCVCLSEQQSKDQQGKHKTTILVVGIVLLPVCLALSACCLIFRVPIEAGCKTMNDSNPCKPPWDNCRALNIFFTMLIWPLAAGVIGIVLVIYGISIDRAGYYVHCGEIG